MEGLDLNNILDDEEINLFMNDSTDEDSTEETDTEETTEVDANSLFSDTPESVGSEEHIEDKEDTAPDKGDSSSPKSDFFSSIAKALTEEGILPDLDEDVISSIKTPEDLRDAIDEYIKSELSEQQRRIKEALDNEVKPDTIRQYEGVLNFLDNISEEVLKREDEQSENLRKRLIYQDYINRGFSQERAEREVNKALQNGSDIEDAIEALKSNRTFYQNSYNQILTHAKYQKEEEENKTRARAINFRDAIFDEKNKFFGELELDKKTRQKIFDTITKPIYKDKNTGETYTALQKFELDNNDEFLMKLGLIFTLTDGLQNLDGLVRTKVKKEVKRGFRDLESRINNTSRDMYGNLTFISGVDDNSYLGKGLKLAL